MTKCYYIYILASQRHGALYVGMTSDLIKRVYEHRNCLDEDFTSKSEVNQLVYYEKYIEPIKAIKREIRLKDWKREWKIS